MSAKTRTKNGSKKSLTEKDVIYGMEFLGERLMRTIIHGKREPCEYSLTPSGQKVGYRTARKAMQNKKIKPVGDGLFSGDTQTYMWKQ